MKRWKKSRGDMFENLNRGTHPLFKKLSQSSAHKIALQSHIKDNESYYDAAKKETPVSKAEIVNSGDVVSINATGVVSYIEISFDGNISVESLLPSSYHIILGSSKVAILLFGKEYNISELFRYSGRFVIKSAFVKDVDGNLAKTEIVDDNVVEWNKIVSLYSDYDKEWEKGYNFNKAKNIKIKQKGTELSRQLEYARYKDTPPSKDKFAKTAGEAISRTIKKRKKERKGINATF